MSRNSTLHLADAQVEMEIARLRQSSAVKLAKKEQNIIHRRRQNLCGLLALEKRGKQLEAMGITTENMQEMLFGDDLEEEAIE